MQPISNTSLAPTNATPTASNAAGRSGRSSATDEQQQFSPMLHAAIESSSTKNPQVHSQRSDNNSPPEQTSKSGRQVSGDKKPISSTAPVDLPTLLRAHALSLQALEIKSAAPATNFAGDASSSGSKTSTAAADKTFNSQPQVASRLPTATASGLSTTIVIPALQSNQMQSLSTLSSTMVSEASAQPNQLRSATAVSVGIFGASANTSPELSSTSTKSNASSIPDSNLKLQKEPAGVIQASRASVSVVASSSEQSANSTSALTLSSSQQVDTKPSADPPSPNVLIPPVPDLLGTIANQSASVLNSDKLGQQNPNGSPVSASDLRQKSDGSQSPSPATSTTAQTDPRFASLLSSITQHPTIPLSASDQKPSGTVQRESSTPVPAFSVPASPSDSSQTQDSSSAGNGKQSGSQLSATSAATDGTNQFSMNMHSAVAPKTDLVTQTMVAAPVSLLSTSNKPANPAASLLQTSARSLETPQQATSTTNWGGGHFVTDARLIQTPALSEMRISMRSDQLGSVEVRAHSVGDEMGAAITVEKRDAHTALAIELPALQQSLTDKHINLASVVLTQGSLSSTAGDSHASPQQGERNPSNTPFASAYLNQDAPAVGVTSSTLSVGPAVIFNSHGRLSVHA
jgi:trimeric autotransporter adhesin